jgi:hypothetical protein
MEYVEEVFPEEPIQAPSKHLLFIVPDNWQPPSCLLGETTMDANGADQHCNNKENQTEEFTTCYIEEETPEALDSQETACADEHFTVIDNESAKGEPTRSQGLEATMEQQRGKETCEAEYTRTGGEPKEGGKLWDGGMAPMPHPISTMQKSWCVQPPFFHPEHLDMMFDLRSQVVDQLHHAILIS